MGRKFANTDIVLVGHTPGAILAQQVRDFDHAMSVASGLVAAMAPGLVAGFQWWIEPASNAIQAGSQAMADEVEAWHAANPKKGAA